ncbi:MAG: metalloenzyme [Ignavibacteria bacterium]|nr:metalloenzyme [Ignavibacteria bacterium]
MNNILMIFVDGVGIGKEDYEFNPFFKYGFKTFSELFGGIPSLDNPLLKNKNRFLFPADARLGVEGLPQSGTGQTSIFCGINAAKLIGKHFGPFPYSTLIPVIKEKNIFKHFLKKKQKTFFANAYPKVFFDYINSGKQRLSVTSLSCRLSGIRLNRIVDVRKGNALTAEITNERWNTKLGYSLPVIKPETAARRLLRIASKNKFTLYEYFLTDHIGHGRYDGETESTLRTLDDFLFTILYEMDYKKLSLIICSDHGNFEDLSMKTHTLNPALTITAGKYSKQLFKSIKNIAQIKSAIVNIVK